MIQRKIIPRHNRSFPTWYVHVPKDIRYLIGKSRQTFTSKSDANAFAKDMAQKREVIEALRQNKIIFGEMAAGANFMPTSAMGLPHLSLTDAFAAVVASKKQSGKRSNSVSTLSCALKSFAEACQKPAGDVLAADVESWLYTNEWTPQTRKGRHTALNTAFNWLVKRRMMASNPVSAVDAPAVAFKKPEILTVDVIEKILRTCEKHDPALLGMIVMILYGGLRRGESARALPENVVGGVIELTGDQTKLNCARNVKISDTLAAWLAVPGVELGGKHLFKRMKRIRELAGVEIPQNALRHSAASYWRELLGGIEAARLLGHSESVALKSYSAKVTHADAERFVALRPTVL